MQQVSDSTHNGIDLNSTTLERNDTGKNVNNSRLNFCNHQVVGSSPITGSSLTPLLAIVARTERWSVWPSSAVLDYLLDFAEPVPRYSIGFLAFPEIRINRGTPLRNSSQFIRPEVIALADDERKAGQDVEQAKELVGYEDKCLRYASLF